MNHNEIKAMIVENDRRRGVLFSPYDPITGEGSPIKRKMISYSAKEKSKWYSIPEAMYKDLPKLFDLLGDRQSVEGFNRSLDLPIDSNHIDLMENWLEDMRFHYDFEYWAYKTVKIQDKETKKIIPFKLNYPQRILLKQMEEMRLAKIPIRIILVKARQWGGSTLVQIYMAWIQLILLTGWHSVIITDVEDQARNIRGMYSRLAREYPKKLGKISMAPFEGSTKNRIVEERGCVLSIGSVQKPDSLRSFDIAMGHFSEVAFWKSTPQKSPEDLAQSVRASIAYLPNTLIVLESTPKGVGSFFHREWQSALAGKSAYVPVFIPFYKIERDSKEIKNYEKFIAWMQTVPRAMFLWSIGASLESIKWYFDTKEGDNYDDWRMMSEAPATAEEGFQSTGQRVFTQSYVELARKTCMPPSFIGDIRGRSQKGKDALLDIEFQPNDKGLLYIWQMPDREEEISDRYVVTVDIGGRTKDADYSVIKVIDRYWQLSGGKPETVACWRGHLDQDLVAWKAAQLGKIYNNALVVIESNSLDKDEIEGNEGIHTFTVLDEIVKYYKNLYARTDPEKLRQGLPIRYGFHTDRMTKPMIVDELNGALRDEAFTERDLRVCDECDTYEVKPNGSYGAVEGCKDDLVIVTAIGVWICFKFLPIPKVIEIQRKSHRNKTLTEASIL